MSLQDGRILIDPSILTADQLAQVLFDAQLGVAIAYAAAQCYALTGLDLSEFADLEAAQERLEAAEQAAAQAVYRESVAYEQTPEPGHVEQSTIDRLKLAAARFAAATAIPPITNRSRRPRETHP